MSATTDLSAQVSAILFGAVDDETFERVMGAIRRTEAFADLDLYKALQPSWHAALMTYDPPDPIPAGGWSRLMPHTDEAIRIFAALRAALATTGQPEHYADCPKYLGEGPCTCPAQPEVRAADPGGLPPDDPYQKTGDAEYDAAHPPRDRREITLHPGQHEFTTVCRLCGDPGMLHVSVITPHERVSITDPRVLTPEATAPGDGS